MGRKIPSIGKTSTVIDGPSLSLATNGTDNRGFFRDCEREGIEKVARKGRKRNTTAERHDCGKVVQTKPPERADDVRRVGTWNRVKQAVAREMADPRWGSELGRLHYQGRIFETQREAGERLCEIFADHRRYGLVIGDNVVSLPNDQPRVCKYERVSPGEGIKHEPDVVKKAQDNFDSVFSGVIDTGREGVAMWRAVTKLCIDEEPLTYQEELLAKRALDVISSVLGLTGVSKFPKNKVGDV